MPSGWPATSSATTRSAASSATTSSAGPPLADVAAEFDAGPYDAGTLLYRVPDPERFGVAELDADGRVVGFEEKPVGAQERPHPDRRLLPPPRRVRRHRAARAVRPRRVRDHRRAQPLHPEPAPLHPGLRRATGPTPGTVAVAAAGGRAGSRRRRGRPARRRRSSGRSPDGPWATTRPFRRLLVTGGAGFIGSCYVRDVLARRDGTRDHGARQADLRGQRGQPGRRSATTRSRPPGCAFVRGDIADAAVVGRSCRGVDAVVNFAAESHVDRSILDPEAFLVTGVIGVHVLLEACRTAAVAAALPAGVHRRGLRLGRGGRVARGRRASSRARRTRRPRRPASCWSGATS